VLFSFLFIIFITFELLTVTGRLFLLVCSCIWQLVNCVCVQSVKLMVEKLDPEQLGVVTFDTFVDEFYPGLFSVASPGSVVRPFTVYHYNGLNRSSLAKVTDILAFVLACCLLQVS